jgi:hypothetical protein
MKKILITGMTASQCANETITRNMSFSGLLKRAFEHAGYEVDLLVPSLSWTKEDLQQYEKVLVGLAPVTSLSAHYSYGALHTMDLLLGDFRMVFYIDAPEPVKITSGFNAWYTDTSNMTKKFYSARRDYKEAAKVENEERFARVIGHLMNDMWHMTLYPTLPWDYAGDKPIGQLPSGANKAIRGINLDAFGINDSSYPAHKTKYDDVFAIDQAKTRWARNIQLTTNTEFTPMRKTKAWTDAEVQEQIRKSKAVVLTPYPSSGTWWSYRYLQAISSLTPVVTEWRESASTGMAGWNMLVSSIDEMGLSDLNMVAGVQYGSYLGSIQSKDNAALMLEYTLLLKEPTQ